MDSLRILLYSYVQVIGWSMWFSEYLFLERNWARDESNLKVWIQNHIHERLWTTHCPKFSFYYMHNYLIWFYLQSALQRLIDYPLPFWLALFVEGTRFTEKKLLAAQEYAKSSGLPVPKNVLIPRTKVVLIRFIFFCRRINDYNILCLFFFMLYFPFLLYFAFVALLPLHLPLWFSLQLFILYIQLTKIWFGFSFWSGF